MTNAQKNVARTKKGRQVLDDGPLKIGVLAGQYRELVSISKALALIKETHTNTIVGDGCPPIEIHISVEQQFKTLQTKYSGITRYIVLSSSSPFYITLRFNNYLIHLQ